MRLIALVTLVTIRGEVPPGDETDIKDIAEARMLIHRGFARASEAKGKANDDHDLLTDGVTNPPRKP